MRRAAAFLMLLAMHGVASAAVLQATDSRGRTLSLDAPAARIVSLAPHVTELLFAAGAGDRVVAVTAYSDYPPDARRLPRVGDAARIDVERIIALAPDLVIAWQSGNAPADLRRIESLGMRVFATEPRTLESIGELIALFGDIAGTTATATKSARDYARDLRELRARYAGRAPVTVFFQIWDRPVMTVNGGHLISDAIALCGGVNIFADLAALAPAVSDEAVIARNPAVMIATRAAGDAADPFARWRNWPQIDAVSRRHLVTIDPDAISRHTPRILTGIEQLCAAIDAAR